MGCALTHFVIYGQCYSMKNSTTHLHRGQLKHPKAAKFEQDFALQVPPEAKKLKLGSEDDLLRASVWVWYPTWRQDVDVEIVWDLLQTTGVVSNDRWIREKLIYGTAIDPVNPRVEIWLESLGGNRA